MKQSKEQHRIANHKWYLKHRERKLQQNKVWRKNNRERMMELQKRWKTDLRLKMLSILGDSCKICGSKQTIQFHEIHGKKHIMDIIYVRDHVEDFISLCGKCHRAKTRLLELNEEQRVKLMNV